MCSCYAFYVAEVITWVAMDTARWAREERIGDSETSRAYFLGPHRDLERP